MKLPIYQVDAFANKIFEGNPAAVVPLEFWLADETMQFIAAENNLAETAFFVTSDNRFHIRWFTPVSEVKLCGHATLATAYVIYNQLDYKSDVIEFESLSGNLSVSRNSDLLTLNFPAQPPVRCDIPGHIIRGLNLQHLDINRIECLKNEDYIVVLDTEEHVSSIVPDHNYLKLLNLRGVAVTSPSQDYDFICRFFAPKYGIAEDPVTGSAYTQLMPYWSDKTGGKYLSAKQISSRGGEVFCEYKDDRVLISGKAVLFLVGNIEI